MRIPETGYSPKPEGFQAWFILGKKKFLLEETEFEETAAFQMKKLNEGFHQLHTPDYRFKEDTLL